MNTGGYQGISSVALMKSLVMKVLKHIGFTVFRVAGFLNRNARKSRDSSTTTTNAEVMSIQTDTCDVIEHVQ